MFEAQLAVVTPHENLRASGQVKDCFFVAVNLLTTRIRTPELQIHQEIALEPRVNRSRLELALRRAPLGADAWIVARVLLQTSLAKEHVARFALEGLLDYH